MTSTAVVGHGDNAEIKVLLFNTTSQPITIAPQEVIAQIVIDMTLKVHLHELLEEQQQ